MKKIYIAPKNKLTEKLSIKYPNFSEYIDKYKKDSDCTTIEKIDNIKVEKLIIYSPQYFEEIYTEYLQYTDKKKITFYLGYGIYSSSLPIVKIYYKIYLKIIDLKKRYKNFFKVSETSKVRKNLEGFCLGNGIDIGFGGDPITKSAISVDMFVPYANYENAPLNLKGSGDNLYWFKDNVLDYVYSSHLLEDFEDTEKVLTEWIRVLKPNGNLVLFLPNEQVYRQYCLNKGNKPNHNHIHDYFGLDFLKNIIKKRDDVEIVYELEPSNIYSFELVLKKIT